MRGRFIHGIKDLRFICHSTLGINLSDTGMCMCLMEKKNIGVNKSLIAK